MSLTLAERRKRVDTSLQEVFKRINLVNKDLGDSLNDVVKRELLSEDRFTEEGLVEELEAFHDYVLDKLEYHDDERLYVSRSRKRRLAGGFEPVFKEPKTVEEVVAEVEESKPQVVEAEAKTTPVVVEESTVDTTPESIDVVPVQPVTTSLPPVPVFASEDKEDEPVATVANATVEVSPEVVAEAKSAKATITPEEIVSKDFTEQSKGYSQNAVDNFLDEVAEFFAKENPSRLEIKAEIKRIRDAEFPKAKVFQKGPDMDEVDDYLDLLIAALEAKI